MKSGATTVAQYLAELPPDRRAAISAVREVILRNLDADYEEGMQYGMIGYYVPHSVFPAGYRCDPRQPLPFVSLGSQKNHMSLYMMPLYVACVSGNETPQDNFVLWFQKAWGESGKKLDMGKSCIRFKTLDDLALDVIGEAIKRIPTKKWIESCQSVMVASKKDARVSKNASTKATGRKTSPAALGKQTKKRK